MAMQSNVNIDCSVNGGCEAMFRLKELLKTCGWTVTSSSDGTTYNAAGDQITLPGAGAGGMNNASAWFVIRDFASKLWYTVQRGTGGNNNALRVKVARVAPAAGIPGATRVPSQTTAADEQILLGGGTDAAPTYGNFGTAATFSGRAEIVAWDAQENGEGFRPFFLTTVIGAVTNGFFGLEVMEDGQYPTGDTYPMMTACGAALGASGSITSVNTATSSWFSWYTPGSVWTSYQIAAPALYGLSTILFGVGPASSLVGVSPYSTRDEGIPLLWGRPVTGTFAGFRGVGRMLRLKGVGRNHPDTTDLASASARIYFDNLLIPWPTAVVPI